MPVGESFLGRKQYRKDYTQIIIFSEKDACKNGLNFQHWYYLLEMKKTIRIGQKNT